MRKSGILMHITSLPGNYGIGTMGKSAFDFVDFLEKSGQQSWQILPLTPTGYGDSPYQSNSAYAGNPYLIDLDLLIEEGLLTTEEVADRDWQWSSDRVDFGRQYNNKLAVLRQAYARFQSGADFDAFLSEQEAWLPDFALFMALKGENNSAAWYTWEDGLKFRKARALNAAKKRLADEIRFYCFVQFVFYKQWTALLTYAHSKGIEIIGDVPIYVPYDSVEVWCEPGLFQLDKTLTPTAVAGCPPDAFSDDGQLWGNPLYNWTKMKKQNFAWWVRRMAAAGKLYDVIRLDHFRGFEAYWSVPYGDTTAKGGKWIKGPDMDFVNALKTQLPEVKFIAEDLGTLTQEVLDLRDNSGYPGMKVLGFAFDGCKENEYLPHNYPTNSVCYTGTHDNMTTLQWFDTASYEALDYIVDYMGLEDVADKMTQKELVWSVIKTAMASVSDLCIVQMQDYLTLGEESRMNFPGTMTTNNWTWRAAEGFASDALAERIAALTERYGRAPLKDEEPAAEAEAEAETENL